MINVLFVPTSDYLGHPFPQRHNQIFERIQSLGEFDVHVVRFNLFGEVKRESITNVHKLHELSIKPLPLYYLSNILFHGAGISKVSKDIGADVIVLSNIAPAVSYLLFESGNVPIAFDLPDYFPTSASGYFLDLCSFIGRVITGSFSTMLRWVLRRSDVVTVASLALHDFAKKNGVRNPVYLPNGISENFFKLHDGRGIRRRCGFTDDELVIGFLGSLEFWLDLEPLLDGLRMALDSGIPARLLLVGGRLHTNYLNKVKAWIHERRLEEYVFWAGYIPYADVPEYIAAMDLTTLPFKVDNPTAYYAGPNKLWEYLSQRKPVLATPIPEVGLYSDLVETVVEAKDYYNCFSRYCKDPSNFLEKVETGQEHAKDFSWDNSASLMQKTLLEMLT